MNMFKRPMTVVAIVFLGAIATACDKTTAEIHRLPLSPAGYEVRVTGDTQAPSLPLVENVLRFEVWRPDKELLAVGELYRGDFHDISFRDKYEREEWETPTLLRFVLSMEPPLQSRDQITLINDSTVQLAYVRVLCGDLYLALDVPASKTIVLHPTAHVLYVEVDGKFVNGARLSHASYEIEGIPIQTRNIRVVITPGRTTITADE